MENSKFSISEEYSKAELGDERLNKRLARLSKHLSSSPGGSFPQATGTVADLEATYRFLGNPKVSAEKLLQPHIQCTAVRSANSARVVVAHDSTKFIFRGDSRREQIGWLHPGNQGFLGHFALAMNRDKSICPLGVLGFETLFPHGATKKGEYRNGKKDVNRESLRWGRLVEKVESVIPPSVCPIHVMDREADDYELFSQLIRNQCRFVIRVRHDRSFCRRLGERKQLSLNELLEGARSLAEREITLSSRKANEFSKTKKAPKVRAGRKARVQFFVTPIQIPKPKHLGANYTPSLIINCVHVREIKPPKNQEPVDWKLLTTEPVDTAEDILNVVDDYRARWLIEEYFKALKTGCSYEKRQLESKQTLLNALAIFTPIAWQLLVLRSVSRESPQISAQFVLSKNQLALLQAVSQKKISESPTLIEVTLAIAALGGHIPNNGPPGWIVLGRGMEKLLTMEISWSAAKWKCDQS